MSELTPQMRQKLKSLLIRHEQIRSFPYLDGMSNITIGIGRNLSDRGLLPSEIDLMFSNDIDYFHYKLSHKFLWFNQLNEARQIALIDLCFAGFSTFCTFTKMISYLEKGDFAEAANEILDSHYAKQVGHRADDLAQIIRTGELI